jgi:hypothetical protein
LIEDSAIAKVCALLTIVSNVGRQRDDIRLQASDA